MEAQTVVVVGGGQAGFQVAASLREGGHAGPVKLLAGEGVLPYQRPPLSKGYLIGGPGAEVELRPQPFYASRGIDVVRGDPATLLDREERHVVLRSGRLEPYRWLVLATGAEPRALPVPGAHLDGVLALRTVKDADMLRRCLEPGRRLVVVGAGMIGLEVAATARKRGLHVTVVETLPVAMARVMSGLTAAHLTAEHRKHGVRIEFGCQVTAFCGDSAGHVRSVAMSDGRQLPADVVVVAVGVAPRTELAAQARLDIADGVVVDEYLRSSDPAIYAVGDCARYPSRHADAPLRLESVQNATSHGRHAAAGICGVLEPYQSVPWFWTDQYDIKVQIAGITHGHDSTVVAGQTAQGRFSVYCFRDGRLVGVESVNRPSDHFNARRLLAGDLDVLPENLSGTGLAALPMPAQAPGLPGT
jgi:3-phenylpropionate/trans-cinnamate dioxygenase ferredoxin reductase component